MPVSPFDTRLLPAISFKEAGKVSARTRLLLVAEDDASAALRLCDEIGERLTAAALATGTIGKPGEIVDLLAPDPSVDRLILLGAGRADALDCARCEAIAASLVRHLSGAPAASLSIQVEAPVGCRLSETELAAHFAFGLLLASYRFDRYRTLPGPSRWPGLRAVEMLLRDAPAAERAFRPLAALANGIATARDLANTPANLLPPQGLADFARKLQTLGVDVDVLGEPEIRALGMGGIMSVGAGSAQPSALIVLHLNRASDPGAPPLALVGKGVCFDAGGLSIKSSAGQELMKMDMAGAAAVIGTIQALAIEQADVNVVGMIAAVENMPDGNAQRPGDVITSMAGLTIETMNTDYEGRVVLADAIHYAIERFAPASIVDIATLTNAIHTALGDDYAGLFTRDDQLAEALVTAAANGDHLWRMPLDESHRQLMRSRIADLRNYPGSHAAGASAGAAFLSYFVCDTPWAHIDIGGVAWRKDAHQDGHVFATGYGVRLLYHYAKNIAEADGS